MIAPAVAATSKIPNAAQPTMIATMPATIWGVQRWIHSMTVGRAAANSPLEPPLAAVFPATTSSCVSIVIGTIKPMMMSMYAPS